MLGLFYPSRGIWIIGLLSDCHLCTSTNERNCPFESKVDYVDRLNVIVSFFLLDSFTDNKSVT